MKTPSLANPLSAVVALMCVVATVFGRILLPGSTGRASGATVDHIELFSSFISYASAVSLAGLVGLGAWELSLSGRASKNHTIQRALVVGLSGGISALTFLSFPQPLFPVLCFSLAGASMVAMAVSASCLFSVQLTKTVGVAMTLGVLAVIHRVVAWRMVQPDQVSDTLAAIALWVHGASLILECGLQLVVTTWVATRSPWRGRFLAHLGTGLSLVLAYILVRTNIDEGGQGIIAMLRAALVEGTLPRGFALAPLEVFLTPASICLAIVTAIQPRIYSPIPACLSLLVVSRLRADVPLDALMIAASAMFALVAVRQRLRASYEISQGSVSETAA